ncbi:MAG: pyruvate dehydrogenase (acetyl-transferring) E1 component subunit alpha [Bacteriovoracaceae bacterium]|nr:pyruvate dehydrogenase (acetyl-transferring) E1 component subunit alpha [Bacteriovoracaceae bacterium]
MLTKVKTKAGHRLQILNEEGELTAEAKNYPMMSNDQILESFKYMQMSRIADEWAVSLNRQGRMPTYAPNKGQEANSMGSFMALRKDDWVVPAFREMAGMLQRGLPLSQLYLYWLGNEMGSCYDVEKFHMLPIAVPLSSQTLHAVGLSFADKYKKTDRVSLTFIGDGATSEGDFYEAMNFAGAWKTPTIFFIQNNQWAISTPTSQQTAVKVLADKAVAAGIEGVQVDGNDLFAVYAATKLAADNARKNNVPSLIEGFTYRLGAHTTADDPTRYREEKDVLPWIAKDPLIRLEKYILNNHLMTSDEIESLRLELTKSVKAAFNKAEAHDAPTLLDTFQYTYKEMPELLKEQMELIGQNGKEEL